MGTDWSLVSSSMPQPGGLTSTLGFPLGGVGQTGEIFKQTGSPPGYQSWSYADGSWWSTQEPRVEIGEAFWARASPNAYIWKRVLLPLDEPRVPEAFPGPIRRSILTESCSIARRGYVRENPNHAPERVSEVALLRILGRPLKDRP